MQVMLLAAGLGTRLWPLTVDRAKPAVPFLGRPLIAGLVEHLARHGLQRMVVNLHHRPESVERALGGISGVHLSYSHESEILGTAGALAKARDEGLLARDEPTLVVNAKLYTDIDLTAVMAAHQASRCPVTMVLRDNLDLEAFREVFLEGDRISGFGKGREPDPQSSLRMHRAGGAPLLFTGIHVLEPEVLRAIPARFCDTVGDIYPPLVADRRVHGYRAEGGRWWELSTPERYLALHVRAQVEGLTGAATCSTGAVVEGGARVQRAVLWEDAVVQHGATVEDAVIGAGVTIRAGERVEGAIVVRRDLVKDPRDATVWGNRLTIPLALSTEHTIHPGGGHGR